MLIVTGVLLGVVLMVMVGESIQEMQLAGWIPLRRPSRGSSSPARTSSPSTSACGASAGGRAARDPARGAPRRRPGGDRPGLAGTPAPAEGPARGTGSVPTAESRAPSAPDVPIGTGGFGERPQMRLAHPASTPTGTAKVRARPAARGRREGRLAIASCRMAQSSGRPDDGRRPQELPDVVGRPGGPGGAAPPRNAKSVNGGRRRLADPLEKGSLVAPAGRRAPSRPSIESGNRG
jgi:hypothetical protein